MEGGGEEGGGATGHRGAREAEIAARTRRKTPGVPAKGQPLSIDYREARAYRHATPK